jgi:hypothetical protein
MGWLQAGLPTSRGVLSAAYVITSTVPDTRDSHVTKVVPA